MELYRGDCLELMKDITDGSVDMILCDLPYGTTRRNAWDQKLDLSALWKEYRRIIKHNGAILLFAQLPFNTTLAMGAPDILRYEWVWKKSAATGHLNAKKMPMKAHENILVFYNSLPTYNPQFSPGKPYTCMTGNGSTNYDTQKRTLIENNGVRFPTDVLDFASEKGYHPTQKPVPLLEYLVKTYTNEGETVLDNCMGSGSTGVACVNTGRNFIGIELDEQYFDIAKKRIEEAQNAKADDLACQT